MIVDAQVHLWKANSPDWPWQPGARPQLPEPFTIERALAMMDEAGVDRVVIVPPSLNDRNDYALEAHKRHPDRFAVMGRIPLQNPKSAELLPKWKEQPGMLGVRLTFNTPATLAWLSDGTADWFWPAAEKAGLPVMFLAVGAVSKFARIAERYPQLAYSGDRSGRCARQISQRQRQTVRCSR
jgi:predicted TIM-barrel fold metal-dependent hydrolase